MSIVTDLLSGIAEFIADVFVFRRQRETRGSSKRSVDEDAVAVAHFDLVTMFWIALASLGVTALLIFGTGLPVAWGLGIGIALGVAWGCLRHSQLLRD
ncbi:hypothetical protein [Acidovorax sp. LjRoot117]|uniref:hypothetical protein n=1 Tax=Acidovorax sp. LjRoot117 TaxID=3342255 RepID=UPI003ED085BF